MLSFAFSRSLVAIGLTLVVGAVSARAELTAAQRAQLPPPASGRVEFARDIQPIFEASCVQCHARGKAKGLFSLETREDFLEGGDTGPAAHAGRSAESLVVEMISGLDPETIMPKKGKKLTPEQVGLVRAWIDQGLEWPKEINFFKHEPANLRPRELTELAVPATWANPIDGILDADWTKRGIAWPALVDDRTYARRVWLDTIGLLPPADELELFLADRAPDKRERLVRRLLADNQAYTEHWLTFWNDLLRNDYKGTGYIGGGRKPITQWLYAALARNLPYDQFVAQLINPGSESEGFVSGIVWRGVVNASMVPPMQAAQGVSQVFLGVNLKCASCHDSFINEYTLQDSYGLANLYADGPLEIAECDKPTGQMSRAKFLYEEIGSIDPQANRADRLQRLSDLITSRQNGRLPRTIVNRLWQRFLGRGLVEPVDEMDKPAWSPALLDWLAEDLVAHGYDLKHTMTRIMTSLAYQLPAVDLGETADAYVFRGPAVRRLSAEQFSDALLRLGGINYPKGDAKVLREVALPRGLPTMPLPGQPKWIWSTPGAEVKAAPGAVVFERTVTLSAKPSEVLLTIAADTGYEVTVNGAKTTAVGSRRGGTGTDVYDVTGRFRAGENVISVRAQSTRVDDSVNDTTQAAKDKDRKAAAEEGSPAGLILYARIRVGEEIADVVTDAQWTARVGQREPSAAVELGGVDLAPWKLGAHFLEMAAAGKPKDTGPVERASLVAADPLMVALGRPNREQIVTVRQEQPTTLQALELTNGHTLAMVLKRAADQLVGAGTTDPAALITSLYRHALSRTPRPAELVAAQELVGAPAQSEGVQDLLWALTQLPEFQLIY